MKKEIQLLKELLSIPSVNGESNECEIAEFVYRYLKSHGVQTTIQYIDKSHANVIAVIPGKKEQTIIWNGHLDTVPYGKRKEWDTDPEIPKEKEGKIYARGASDMKSGLAAMVYLMGELGRMEGRPENTICFLGTCDEEKGGAGAKYILKENKMPQAELLLIGEPTGCQLGVAQKGCLWIEYSVNGKMSHGAYPWEGCNAIEYGMKVFAQLKNWIEKFEHEILGKATAQITMVHGGEVPNMTPDYVRFTVDIRTVPGIARQTILEKMKKIGKNLYEESSGDVKVEIQILNERRYIELSKDNYWLRRFKDCLKKEGESVREVGINYFTDASILTVANETMPVLLFGPGEPYMAHKANEYIEIEKYEKYIRLLCRIFDIGYPKTGK